MRQCLAKQLDNSFTLSTFAFGLGKSKNSFIIHMRYNKYYKFFRSSLCLTNGFISKSVEVILNGTLCREFVGKLQSCSNRVYIQKVWFD